MNTTELLTELAIQRQRAEAAKSAREKLLEAMMETDAYQDAAFVAREASARIAELEGQLHQAALEEYAENGSKKPFEGVSIKVFSTLKYDMVTALDWCRKNLPEALTLDKRLFEQHAKGVAKTQPLPCVEIVEEARAQIAGDLSKFLPVDPIEVEYEKYLDEQAKVAEADFQERQARLGDDEIPF